MGIPLRKHQLAGARYATFFCFLYCSNLLTCILKFAAALGLKIKPTLESTVYSSIEGYYLHILKVSTAFQGLEDETL